MYFRTKKEKILITCVSLCFLGLFMLYSYVFIDIKSKNEHTALLSEEIATMTREQDEIDNLKKTVAFTETKRSDLSTHFVDGSNPAPFLDAIENLGVSSDTVVVITSVEQPKQSNTLGVSFLATGSFDSIYRLIRLLENLPYKIKIEKVFLSKKSSPQVDAKIPVRQEWTANITFTLISFISKK